MLDITQQKGTATELRCILDLTNLGYRCLKSVDESSKYDVVADMGMGKFIRIQCKTSSWVTDTIEPNVAFAIATSCITTNTKSTTRHKYSKDDIDYLIEWYTTIGLEEMSLALGRTEGTVANKVNQFRNQGKMPREPQQRIIRELKPKSNTRCFNPGRPKKATKNPDQSVQSSMKILKNIQPIIPQIGGAM